MNEYNLKVLKNYVNKNKYYLSENTIYSLEKDFELRFHHESTKIEGNTLTLNEVKTVLVDGVSIGGKLLREIYEVTNNNKAYEYVKNQVFENKELSEDTIKDIHEIVVENIFHGGIYRTENVRILGASFIPPTWEKIRNEMKFFIEDMKRYPEGIEKAAWIHAEFVRIHPFADENGRTARLLLNYELMKLGYLPIIIKSENRVEYYEALDNYGKNKDIKLFLDLIYKLEEERLLDYKKEINMIKYKANNLER